MKPKKIKEKKLLYRVQVYKDAEAFGELYDHYITPLYRFIFFKVSVKEDAEDLTSDVFLKAWNHLIIESQEEIRSFTGLIYKIARNSVIDYYRKKSVRFEQPLETGEAFGKEDREILRIEVKYEADKIMNNLKQLKHSYREVIQLRYINELSISEMSEILGKKKTNVRVTLYRALKLLKKVMEKEQGKSIEK